MNKKINKKFITILVATIVASVFAYFSAKYVDKKVAEITKLRADINEATRIASDYETQSEERVRIDDYKKIIEGNTPSPSKFADILSHIEDTAGRAGMEVFISLEDGVLKEGAIEFKSGKEKEDFLKQLQTEISGQTTVAAPVTPAAGVKQTNAVLQMQQQSTTVQSTQVFKLNYVTITASVNGSYEQVLTFLKSIQNSSYIFIIDEIRMSIDEQDVLVATITFKAIIFE